MNKQEAMAIRKLYESLGYDEAHAITDILCDFLTINTCRNGKRVLWYEDDNKSGAIYIDTLELLPATEIENELI